MQFIPYHSCSEFILDLTDCQKLFSTPKEDISFKDCDDWPHSLVPDKECLVMYPWNLRV